KRVRRRGLKPEHRRAAGPVGRPTRRSAAAHRLSPVRVHRFPPVRVHRLKPRKDPASRTQV
ncbi:MAG: hypothetical protein ACOVPA_10810, partial [Rubrivivax sp.]